MTADHFLACGLLAGDVAPIWEQDAELRGKAVSTVQLLTADNVYDIYTMVRASCAGSPTQPHLPAWYVGMRVGVALAALSLSGGDIEGKGHLVFDTLFEGDDLRLREGLARAEVHQILEQASPPTNLTGQLSWKGVGAR